MATLTGLIPVTVGTFEAYHGGGGGIPLGGGGLGTQSAGPYIHIGFYKDYMIGFKAQRRTLTGIESFCKGVAGRCRGIPTTFRMAYRDVPAIFRLFVCMVPLPFS